MVHCAMLFGLFFHRIVERKPNVLVVECTQWVAVVVDLFCGGGKCYRAGVPQKVIVIREGGVGRSTLIDRVLTRNFAAKQTLNRQERLTRHWTNSARGASPGLRVKEVRTTTKKLKEVRRKK